eukprot:gnl/TRDRNA2_/TRDRNA2_43906_c0_seq1.p1 gnl/TRDRNA2_/TRDRNA2_43906_c0~~gnl/TRDRNA2_/TRDRNA2_43906_c0_seq1.p1  ORF type:complete len:302 (+),score=44.26 gnl/TRDRNA2_/TRDRNA2_43906_c0_seq1:70-975(+)
MTKNALTLSEPLLQESGSRSRNSFVLVSLVLGVSLAALSMTSGGMHDLVLDHQALAIASRYVPGKASQFHHASRMQHFVQPARAWQRLQPAAAAAADDAAADGAPKKSCCGSKAASGEAATPAPVEAKGSGSCCGSKAAADNTVAAVSVDASGQATLTTQSWLPLPIINRLSDISAVASTLCAIKCTVFPIMIAVLPFLGMAGVCNCWLHKVSKMAALYLVGPISGVAIAANWVQHQNPLLAAWGLSGIAFVLLANLSIPHAFIAQHVATHQTAINLLGAGLLLSSNHYARTLTPSCCASK